MPRISLAPSPCLEALDHSFIQSDHRRDRVQGRDRRVVAELGLEIRIAFGLRTTKMSGREGVLPRARVSRADPSHSGRFDTLSPSESGACSSYPLGGPRSVWLARAPNVS